MALAAPGLDDGAEEDDRIVPDDELLLPEDEPPVPEDEPLALEPPEVVCDDDPRWSRPTCPPRWTGCARNPAG